MSLLLCVAVCVLWVRSYRRFDDVVYCGRYHVNNVCSYRGRLFVQLGWSSTDLLARSSPPYSAGGWFWDSLDVNGVRYPTADMSRGWRLGGFDASSRISKSLDASGRPDSGEHVIIVPYWFLTLAALGMPTAWVRRRLLLAGRSSARLCPTCGYDLRATPERCPECGAEASTQ